MNIQIARYFSVALVILTTSALSLAEESMKKQYTDDELISILQDDAYRAVELMEERIINIKVDGQMYVLYIYDDNDLQLYYGLTGYSITLEVINDWNRTRRLSRAYLDEDNDPVLESDLLANAGITPKQITEWVSVFLGSSQAYRQHVNENDQSE